MNLINGLRSNPIINCKLQSVDNFSHLIVHTDYNYLQLTVCENPNLKEIRTQDKHV